MTARLARDLREREMTMNRREALAVGAGAFAGVGLAGLPAFAAAPTTDELVAEFTGGAAIGDGGGLTLTTPEIAENGSTVPIEVVASGAVAIIVLAPANPAPGVATFNFGPLNATQRAGTRIRLAKTQDVVAIAKMADGSFVQASNTVKVTIGGCGG